MSNSHFWKRSEAGGMTILESHVGPHIPNIGYLEVYVGICKYIGVYGGIWEHMKYMKVYGGIWVYSVSPLPPRPSLL